MAASKKGGLNPIPSRPSIIACGDLLLERLSNLPELSALQPIAVQRFYSDGGFCHELEGFAQLFIYEMSTIALATAVARLECADGSVVIVDPGIWKITPCE